MHPFEQFKTTARLIKEEEEKYPLETLVNSWNVATNTVAMKKKAEEEEDHFQSARRAAASMLEDIGVDVIIYDGNLNALLGKVATGDVGVGGCSAAQIGDDKFVFAQDGERDDPDRATVFNILHEAAHLLMNDYGDEYNGVLQAELILAKALSDRLFEEMKAIHRDEGSVPVRMNSKKWKEGAKRAIKVFSEFNYRVDSRFTQRVLRAAYG